VTCRYLTNLPISKVGIKVAKTGIVKMEEIETIGKHGGGHGKTKTDDDSVIRWI